MNWENVTNLGGVYGGPNVVPYTALEVRALGNVLLWHLHMVVMDLANLEALDDARATLMDTGCARALDEATFFVARIDDLRNFVHLLDINAVIASIGVLQARFADPQLSLFELEELLEQLRSYIGTLLLTLLG